VAAQQVTVAMAEQEAAPAPSFLGLSRDRIRRENEKALADLSERIGSLSPTEREIMIHLARGRPNISSRLPVSDIDHG
jgi:hypothetical protein